MIEICSMQYVWFNYYSLDMIGVIYLLENGDKDYGGHRSSIHTNV